ncbi:MAG: helix-turn-helix domain-containing protein [Clostridiales bacterium]|nr:helix-turn-helix domain-containing protein [Clostridiales bacterium]
MNENRITITPKEAAGMLGLSMTTMYELVHSEGFPSIRVGKKILINVEGLKHWVNERSGMVV